MSQPGWISRLCKTQRVRLGHRRFLCCSSPHVVEGSSPLRFEHHTAAARTPLGFATCCSSLPKAFGPSSGPPEAWKTPPPDISTLAVQYTRRSRSAVSLLRTWVCLGRAGYARKNSTLHRASHTTHGMQFIRARLTARMSQAALNTWNVRLSKIMFLSLGVPCGDPRDLLALRHLLGLAAHLHLSTTTLQERTYDELNSCASCIFLQ